MLIYKALLLESWSATILNTSSNTNGNLSLSLSVILGPLRDSSKTIPLLVLVQ